MTIPFSQSIRVPYTSKDRSLKLQRSDISSLSPSRRCVVCNVGSYLFGSIGDLPTLREDSSASAPSSFTTFCLPLKNKLLISFVSQIISSIFTSYRHLIFRSAKEGCLKRKAINLPEVSVSYTLLFFGREKNFNHVLS